MLTKSNRIIYILGPEGVGKSTHAYLLIQYLRKYYGAKVTNIEISVHSLFMHLLREFLIRCGRVEYYQYPNAYVARIDRLFMYRIINLWIILETMAFLFSHLLKITILKYLGFIIILTRHVVDFLVNIYAIGFTCRRLTYIHYVLTYVLLRLFTYDLVIYLDANYEALVERYKRRHTYIELRKWIEFYRYISIKLLMLISNQPHRRTYYIDTTSRTLSSTFTKILGILYSKDLLHDHA